MRKSADTGSSSKQRNHWPYVYTFLCSILLHFYLFDATFYGPSSQYRSKRLCKHVSILNMCTTTVPIIDTCFYNCDRYSKCYVLSLFLSWIFILQTTTITQTVPIIIFTFQGICLFWKVLLPDPSSCVWNANIGKTQLSFIKPLFKMVKRWLLGKNE